MLSRLWIISAYSAPSSGRTAARNHRHRSVLLQGRRNQGFLWVEFHHDYVDPSYNYDPASATPPIQTRAADVAAQLQALNLPTAVYYGLLAFATSLGVPVGNVVDLVIGLGLGVIIVAHWDQIKDVWSDIVNIFVNAFGSVVNDAFR